jgi:2-oxoglutarate ferredoxin oxidoreductase subunit alpha
MVRVRAAKVAGIASDVPEVELEGDDDADLLVVGWGSTWGAIGGAVDRCHVRGLKVARIHLTHLNPLPRNLGDVLRRFDKVLVPEMNLGQLSRILRAEYLVDAQSLSKVRGAPFTAGEIERAIIEALEDDQR